MPFLDRSTLTYPVTNSFPGRFWQDTRDPTSADFMLFRISDIWINVPGTNAFLCVARTTTQATWLPLAIDTTGILTITGDSGGAIDSDDNGNLNLVGSGPFVIAGDQFTHTLTVQSDGTIALTYNTDDGSASPIAGVLSVVGDGIIETSGLGDTITIDASGDIATNFSCDTGGIATPSNNVLTVAGGNGITTNASGSTVTINLDGGGSAVDSFIPDSGTSPVVPAANGSVTMTGASGLSTVGGTNTLNFYAHTVAKWVVDPTANVGTHQTIQAAINAASSGQTIFIRPGIYTENLTLKAGVNLTAFPCDAYTPNVSIVGKCTLSSAGHVSMSGLNFETNGDFAISVSGSGVSLLTISESNFSFDDNTGISFTNSNASSALDIFDCNGNLGTTGIALHSMSSPGSISYTNVYITNTGNSSTASDNSAGGVFGKSSQFTMPFSSSGTGSLDFQYCNVSCTAVNTTAYTVNGNGFTLSFQSYFAGGTAPAISIGAGATLRLYLTVIDSSNANGITGAGSLFYGGISFPGGGTFNVVSVTPTRFFAGTLV